MINLLIIYFFQGDSLEVGDNFINWDIPVQTIVTAYKKMGDVSICFLTWFRLDEVLSIHLIGS